MTVRSSSVADTPYRAFCTARQQARQERTLKEIRHLPHGRARYQECDVLNFSSNDYLGLSHHPALIAQSQAMAARDGTGATASRLVSGNAPLYTALEMRLAQGKNHESALILGSGYQANVTVLAALADTRVIGKPVAVIADRLCHNSLLQGVILSGARLIRFRHNDYLHLQEILNQPALANTHVIIVSESVFGMDGDRADLTQLVTLAQQRGAMLYIDEAHATGLFGPDGFGLTAAYRGQIDVVMGTFGKALGSFGAYIACTAAIRDYLIQRCGGLIYSTALPPSILGTIGAALELLPALQAERDHLQRQAALLRASLRQQGWDCGASDTHIIPVILGDEMAATTLSARLLEQGILVPAIRPPTVPRGTSRLRFSLSAAHDAEAIQHLIACMAVHAPGQAAEKSCA